MDIDIETEHVVMQPEWHRMIDTWVTRCRKAHPDVAYVDLTLRHEERGQPGEEVDVMATAGGRNLRVARHGITMSMALLDALAALERELLVHEAVYRRMQ
jgi:ribosome-associated translation inhibitor RaiA